MTVTACVRAAQESVWTDRSKRRRPDASQIRNGDRPHSEWPRRNEQPCPSLSACAIRWPHCAASFRMPAGDITRPESQEEHHGRPASRYHEVYARWQRDPEGFWAEAAHEIDWFETPKKMFDPNAGIYGRWFAGGVMQHLLQRARPPCARRARRPGRADLRLARSPTPSAPSPMAALLTEVQVLGAMLRDFGVEQGRPRHPLYADGAGGGVRHARLRAHRRRPFGGVRRLRRQGAGDPHRRRQAEGDPVGELRHRGRPRRALQAAARRGDRARAAQAERLPDPATAASARRR